MILMRPIQIESLVIQSSKFVAHSHKDYSFFTAGLYGLFSLGDTLLQLSNVWVYNSQQTSVVHSHEHNWSLVFLPLLCFATQIL